MTLTPGTRLGVYEVGAQIGEGGMGQVFRATDTKLKRQVAISGGRIVAATLDTSGAEVVIGKPVALFADVYVFGAGVSTANYDVTPDGRFIMIRRGVNGGKLRLVINWTEELKQILAAGGVQ